MNHYAQGDVTNTCVKESIEKKHSCGHVHKVLTPTPPSTHSKNRFLENTKKKEFLKFFSICVSIDLEWSETYNFEVSYIRPLAYFTPTGYKGSLRPCQY